MSWIVIGRAEIETTELGLGAFDGKVEVVREALRAGVSWTNEGCKVLQGALYGGHLALALEILTAGSPINEDCYFIAFDYLPEFLDHLPLRPELLEPIRANRRWTAFNQALVEEDIDLARQLLREGVPIREKILLTHGMGNLCPIHYAVRRGNLELVKMVVAAGADVNVLTDQGQSPLRMVAENILLSARQRREVLEFLKAHGAKFIPEITAWEKLALWLGKPLRRP